MKHFVVIQSKEIHRGRSGKWWRMLKWYSYFPGYGGMPLARKEMIIRQSWIPTLHGCLFLGLSRTFEEYISCDVPTYAIAGKDTSLQLLLLCLLPCGFSDTPCLTFLHLIRPNRWMYFRDKSTLCNHYLQMEIRVHNIWLLFPPEDITLTFWCRWYFSFQFLS